ncbi:response regulator [Verrucomicrobiota bacterium sgz303538]
MGNVLIVDDNELILRLARMVLTKDGHAVSIAHNLREAKDVLATSDRDVVLTDESMPGGSGFDLLQWLHDEKPATRTVLMSGKMGPSFLESARRLGVTGTLPKPFTGDELREVISHALAEGGPTPSEQGRAEV